MSDKREELEEDFDDFTGETESGESLFEDEPVDEISTRPVAQQHHEWEKNDDYWIVRGGSFDKDSAYSRWSEKKVNVLSRVQEEIEDQYVYQFSPTAETKVEYVGGWYVADGDYNSVVKQVRIHDRETLRNYIKEDPEGVLAYYTKMDNPTLAATLEICVEDFSALPQSPELIQKLSKISRYIFSRKDLGLDRNDWREISFDWGCLADLSYHVANSKHPFVTTSVGIKSINIISNSLQKLHLNKDAKSRLRIKRQILSRAEHIMPTKSVAYKRAKQPGAVADVLAPVFVDDLLLGDAYFALQQSQEIEKEDTLTTHEEMRKNIIKGLSKNDIIYMLELASKYDMSSVSSPNSHLKFFINSMERSGRGDDLVNILSNLATIKKLNPLSSEISIPIGLQNTISTISHAMFSITYRRDLQLSDIANTSDPKNLAWSIHSYGFDWRETKEALLQPGTNPGLIERLNKRLQGSTYWSFDSVEEIKSEFLELEQKAQKLQTRFLTEEQQNKYLPALCTSILKATEMRKSAARENLIKEYPELEKHLPTTRRAIDRFPHNLVEESKSSKKSVETPLLRNWMPETHNSLGQGMIALHELLENQSQQLIKK